MSKAVEGAALLAGAVGMGVAAFLDPALLASPWFDKLWETLIVTGIAMEAGAIADALLQNRAQSITTRQPASFRQIVYGEQRVGGIMVYESTTGSHKDQYNMIIVLATHEINAIVNLYLDGRTVFWNESSHGFVVRNGIGFGGTAAQGGSLPGPGGQNYDFSGLVYCEARFGDQLPGDVISAMTANDPTWTTNDQGSPYLGGCTYVYLKVEYDTNMFPQMPEVRFTVQGKNNVVDPRITGSGPSTPPTVLAMPTVLSNGWNPNTIEAAYEESGPESYGWGLSSAVTLAYSSPELAFDENLQTSASLSISGEQAYAGCIWSFAALSGSPPSALWLNVNSMVNAGNYSGRSAGVWYSLDSGASWTQIYNSPNHSQFWDGIELSPTQDTSQVQVMAFMDADTDMAHYVFEINLADASYNSAVANPGVYTHNWALIVADVLQDNQWGLGDIGSVNEEQLIAAANVCDEEIPVSVGGTESQWSLHWHYDTGTGPGDVLQTMMPAAAGRLSRIGGEWFIWPAYWQGPSFTFSDSSLTGPVDWKPYRKQRDLFNRVNGTYIAPNFPYNTAGDLYDANGWYDGTDQNNFPFAFQPTNYPQYAVDALHGYPTDVYLAQDGGIPLPKELVQNCVLSVVQAQRAGKVILLRNRAQGTGTLQMNLDAWNMQPIDVMLMSFTGQGWVDKQLEIASTKFTIDDSSGDVQSVRFQVGVQETFQQIYEWSESEELTVYDIPANPQVGPSYNPAAPTGLTLEADAATAVTGSDGTVTPRILVSWTAAQDAQVIAYNLQYQQSGASSWITGPTVNYQTSSVYLSGVVAGITYNVQLQAMRSNGAVSAWVQGTITVAAPNSVTNSYTNTPQFDLTNPTTTSIAMGNVAVQFGSAVVSYKARTFTIPLPTLPTWYYITVADPSQGGESSPTLTATCQTSDALAGLQGDTYIGAIQVVPGGGSTNVLAGGWPAPTSFGVK